MDDAFKAIAEVLTWQFWVACGFVQAGVWFARKVMGNLSPATGDKGWWKAVLTLLNVVLGLIAAIPAGYLKGDTFAQRAMLGVALGLVSHYAYHLAWKNWLRGKRGGGADGAGAPERRTTDDLPAQGP
jgi:hypothetical protein